MRELLKTSFMCSLSIVESIQNRNPFLAITSTSTLRQAVEPAEMQQVYERDFRSSLCEGVYFGYSGGYEKWHRQIFEQSSLFKGLKDKSHAIFWESSYKPLNNRLSEKDGLFASWETRHTLEAAPRLG